ncbi:hypothetical protein J6590_099310 [Homalodisca vitripennis]|nr:hypothetical protein J6590_099310 [Homalodisca vitripennis]
MVSHTARRSGLRKREGMIHTARRSELRKREVVSHTARRTELRNREVVSHTARRSELRKREGMIHTARRSQPRKRARATQPTMWPPQTPVVDFQQPRRPPPTLRTASRGNRGLGILLHRGNRNRNAGGRRGRHGRLHQRGNRGRGVNECRGRYRRPVGWRRQDKVLIVTGWGP